MKYKLEVLKYEVQRQLRKISEWIMDLVPLQCANCRKLERESKGFWEQHTTGCMVFLCSECREELFSGVQR